MATVKTVNKVIRTYHLELNQEEADFLLSLCGKVGGSPAISRRKHSDAIERALSGSDAVCNYDDLHGCVNVDVKL